MNNKVITGEWLRTNEKYVIYLEERKQKRLEQDQLNNKIKLLKIEISGVI